MRIAVLLLLLLPVTGQDENRSLDNFRRYLARSPYHDQVFDQFVQRLRSCGELDTFLEELTSDGDTSARVLEARLRAEQGEVEAAIILLEGVPAGADRARQLRMLAEFRARAGDRAGERADLLSAVAEAEGDLDLTRELYEELAATQLSAGDRGAARASLERLADLSPGDPATQLDVGSRLARAGFHRAATLHFARAAELGDPARRCEALAALGEQHERLAEGERAIEVYLETLRDLRRGHWLAEELRGRLLRLFERGGRTAQLVDQCQAAVREAPGDEGAREFLALALERDGRMGEALEGLARAVGDFPDDASLSRLRRLLARRSGDHDAEVDELQRLVAQRPRDLELLFALAETLANASRLEAAATRFEEAVRLRSRDASLARRIAECWVKVGEATRARAELERALELASGEVDRHVELAQFLVLHGMPDDAGAVLTEGERAFQDAPRALVALGEGWMYLQRPEGVARCWRAASALVPDDAQLHLQLGELLLAEKEFEEGRLHLREAASCAREWRLAVVAAQGYTSKLYDITQHAAILEREEQRLAEEPTDRGAHLALVMLHRGGQRAEAEEMAWRRLVEARPEDGDARFALAEWLTWGGRYAGALAEYEAALPLLPRRTREILLAQAALLSALGEADEAVERLERVIGLGADDPETLSAVAERFTLLGRPQRAITTWRRVLRHRPEDAEAHLATALVAKELARIEEALGHLRLAWRDRSIRRQATNEMVIILGLPDRIDAEVERLDARVRADPFDLEAALLAADILSGIGRPSQALSRVEACLLLRPYAADLLERKGELCLTLGRTADAFEAFAALRSSEGGQSLAVTRDLVLAHLEAGLTDRAVQLAGELDEPLEVLELFEGDALRAARITLLQAVVARPAAAPQAFERLARECESSGRTAEALAALEGLREVSATGWNVTRRVGVLRGEMGDEEGARAEGVRLLGEVDNPEVARIYFDEIGELSAFYTLTTEYVLASPGDEVLVRSTIELLHREGQWRVMINLARQLRTHATAARVYPPEFTVEGWARWLHGVELGAYALCRPGLIERRLEELLDREDRDQVSEKLAIDTVWLMHMAKGGAFLWRARVRRLIDRYPQSPTLLFAAGELHLDRGDPKGATAYYRQALATLSQPQHVRALAASLERRRARHEARTRLRLIRATYLDEDQVRRVCDISFAPLSTEPWRRIIFPDPFELEVRWACAEGRAGRADVARARFVRLEHGCMPDDVWGRSRIVTLLASAQGSPLDQTLLVELAGQVAQVRADPDFSGTVAAVMASRFLADALGEWARLDRETEAYLSIRAAGHRTEAREFLHRYPFYGDVQDTLEKDWRRNIARLEETEGLGRERAMRAVHDTGVMYAEVLRAGGSSLSIELRQAREEEIWEELLRLNPGDLAALWRQAGRAEWAGDWARAADRHAAGVAARDTLAARSPEEIGVWSGQLLTELIPPRDQAGRVHGWQDLRFRSLGRGVTDPTPHRLGALHATLMLDDTAGAVAHLESLLISDHRLPAEAIEATLAAESYGVRAPRAQEALAHWREMHAKVEE